ncbi:2Fe-2S iron-sulfur cluster-binding protein [Streptomyces sp. NPDC057702]|uniref:2Fe-2S iron-sulfur cluster-binding protein n=1 Tax=unclassified Streptomyces TaxID=2593676 RepID=UPI0036AFCF26
MDGAARRARPGDTVAAVLLGMGRAAWRTTRGGGRRRGVFCGIGVCHDCLVVVNGLPDVRACLREVAPGDVVETQRGAELPRSAATPLPPSSPRTPGTGQAATDHTTTAPVVTDPAVSGRKGAAPVATGPAVADPVDTGRPGTGPATTGRPGATPAAAGRIGTDQTGRATDRTDSGPRRPRGASADDDGDGRGRA